MRQDLIGAKAFRVGHKAPECGDRKFSYKTVKTFEEAMRLVDYYIQLGWKTHVRPVY